MTKHALIMTSDFGVEEPELLSPRDALTRAGIDVTVASTSGGTIQTVKGDKEPASIVQADTATGAVNADDYDLVVIPGGTVNADHVRMDKDAQKIVQAFAASHRPVGAICHGPWLLIDAGVAEGKTLTSYASVRTDLVNAGASWVDEQVFRCPGNDWVLITSRNPGDLEAFDDALIKEIS